MKLEKMNLAELTELQKKFDLEIRKILCGNTRDFDRQKVRGLTEKIVEVELLRKKKILGVNQWNILN